MDLKRDHNFDNHPYNYYKIVSLSLSLYIYINIYTYIYIHECIIVYIVCTFLVSVASFPKTVWILNFSVLFLPDTPS